MDAVARQPAAAERLWGEHPALPPEAPLAMPVQSLRKRPPPAFARLDATVGLAGRRGLIFGLTVLLTLIGAQEMYAVLSVAGLTVLEGLILGLFVLLFAWIGFSFANAVGGTIAMLAAGRRRSEPPATPLRTRTAILMPTYNEAPERVFSGLHAIYASIEEAGAIAAFDIFILSDTQDADIWVAEEAAFLALRRRTNGHARIFYRRRMHNIDRKAGNIAEWVTRFGGAYDHMLVLDADSLMSGQAVVALAAAMEADPQLGLLQSLPIIVGGRSLFARAQQFAGRLYGPLIAHGLAWWHGPDSNYWGHNAIIRTRAFAECAGLPHLKGRKPFGGHILSHDFVEAALIRRGGWAVRMLPDLDGSYEEGPPSLTDLAVRDRRWCQGNLQHGALLATAGLHPVSRLHLLTGIGSYVTSPLWLALLLAGLLAALQARFVPPDYFPSQFSLFPSWPQQDPVRAAWVFVGTMAVLLIPKLLAYLVMLLDSRARRGFGGALRALVGILVETLISGLAAPIMMVTQSAGVAAVLAGKDSGWRPQRRSDGSVAFRDTLGRFAPHSLLGLALAAASLAIALPLFLWMTPVIIGLLFAVPLVTWTAGSGAGARAAAWGLLTTPEERHPSPILREAAELARSWAEGAVTAEAAARLAADPELARAHREMLPGGGVRAAGDVAPNRLIARAKLEDAKDLHAALAWLTPAEKAAALADQQALDRLLALAAAERREAPQPRPR